MKKLTLVLVAVAIVLGLSLVSSYNGLVTLSQNADRQWAQVETQYQRRYDLIPNLVSSVEANLKQEQKVFADIAQARTRYAGATTIDDKTQAASELESAVSRLLVIMENYPELTSQQSVSKLMDELAGTENRISVERRRFNEEVTNYNLSVRRFPGSLMANLFHFAPRPLFESTAGADQAPAVNFNN
jgi:LemA protein